MAQGKMSLCLTVFVHMSVLIAHIFCRTLVPKDEVLLDKYKFEAEVASGRWLAIYCIDDDNDLADERPKVDCRHKGSASWKKIAYTFYGESYIRSSSVMWQPVPINCDYQENVDFIIPLQETCKEKAILRRVGSSEVHRIFSSNTKRYIFLHKSFDDPSKDSDGYTRSSITIMYIRDPRQEGEEELSLQNVPWNQASADLWTAMNLLLAPEENQYIPPPHPQYTWLGEECSPARLVVPLPIPGIQIPVGNGFPGNNPIIQQVQGQFTGVFGTLPTFAPLPSLPTIPTVPALPGSTPVSVPPDFTSVTTVQTQTPTEGSGATTGSPSTASSSGSSSTSGGSSIDDLLSSFG